MSYTRADKSWAEWIAWALEDDGHRVLIQAWDFVPGSNWTASMQEATVRAKRTLAVLSNAYLESAYGKTEWMAAYQGDPQGVGRQLIPVRVEACARPGILGQIVGIDLFGMDEADARSALLSQLGHAESGRAKPADGPTFPGPSGPEAPIAPTPTNPKPVVRHVLDQLHILHPRRKLHLKPHVPARLLSSCKSSHAISRDEDILGVIDTSLARTYYKSWVFSDRRLVIKDKVASPPWSVSWLDTPRLVVDVVKTSDAFGNIPATYRARFTLDGESRLFIWPGRGCPGEQSIIALFRSISNYVTDHP